MDSLKLLEVWGTGVLVSLLEIVRARVTFRETLVLLRSVAVHPRVPLMSTVEGIVAIIGHTIIPLEVETPIVSQDWRNEIEAERS
jgi:hypothetical protein